MKELYDSIIKVLKELEVKNENAMIICHSLGYNGFKRWHRRRTKMFKCWAIQLANDLFDNYRAKAIVPTTNASYSIMSLKEHLAEWDKFLEISLISLTEKNKDFFDSTGTMSCVLKKAIHQLQKDREKVRRWFTRFSETNWSAHDVHVVDYFIHEHERKQEKKGHK